jgi:hypothetical protein
MATNPTLAEARAAKARALEFFVGLVPVVGVGLIRVGDGFGLKVNLAEAPVSGTPLPDTVDGVPVQVEVVGAIHKR